MQKGYLHLRPVTSIIILTMHTLAYVANTSAPKSDTMKLSQDILLRQAYVARLRGYACYCCIRSMHN